jgi:hypothetical protein
MCGANSDAGDDNAGRGGSSDANVGMRDASGGGGGGESGSGGGGGGSGSGDGNGGGGGVRGGGKKRRRGSRAAGSQGGHAREFAEANAQGKPAAANDFTIEDDDS